MIKKALKKTAPVAIAMLVTAIPFIISILVLNLGIIGIMGVLNICIPVMAGILANFICVYSATKKGPKRHKQ